ncbi:MAG: hypothetical protein HWD85_12065 [Flavobacteriaceae bacterium]|nr:hypothetical protein [Flavobacteriaceae bacterium]
MILEGNLKVQHFFTKAFTKATITDARRELLTAIATKVSEEYLNSKTTINLNFICTHNSRRSQLAQVWAYYAAVYFKLPKVKSYSGGTAVTAFHRNTVKTLQNVGFQFYVQEFNHENPKYTISFNEEHKPLLGFSKLFDDAYNSEPFIAITTCSSANENCPFIPNAMHRFHLPYVDPKAFDNSNKTEEAYLETNQQIAAEIHFLFKEIKKTLG